MLEPNNRWLEPIVSELTGPLERGQVSILPDGPLKDLLQKFDVIEERKAATRRGFEKARARVQAEFRLEFERLLAKDFIPKVPGQPAKFSFSGGVPRPKGRPGVGAAIADDALGWLVLWAALVDETEKWAEKKASELGLTVEQWRQMRDDALIIGVLAQVAEQTLTDAELDLAKERRRKRTRIKRTRIHGWSRRI